jgi:hypothetical protein
LESSSVLLARPRRFHSEITNSNFTVLMNWSERDELKFNNTFEGYLVRLDYLVNTKHTLACRPLLKSQKRVIYAENYSVYHKIVQKLPFLASALELPDPPYINLGAFAGLGES